jgi:hypothetical protein
MSDEPRRSDPQAFVQIWQTDVAPVHDKTERSREFRTQYFQLALKTTFSMNAAAMVAVPVIGRLLGARFDEQMPLFLRSEGQFLAGLLLVVLAMLFQWITLDVDVIRQKGERAEARQRMRETGFEDRAGDSMEAERVRSRRHQAKYWRIGVGLMWTCVVLLVLASLLFLRGSLLAGEFLEAAVTP